MDHDARTLSSVESPSTRVLLKHQPISSLLFYNQTNNNNKHKLNQEQQDIHSNLDTSSLTSEMNPLADASGLGSQSHETSTSPPPAKRQRRGKEVKKSTKLAPTRVSKRNAKVLSSNSSMSNTQISTPDLIEASAPPSAVESRASSVVSGLGPTTRSGKRKLEMYESETPSVRGESETVPSGVQLGVVDQDARLNSYFALDMPEDTESKTEERESTISRRGRPPGSGRGRGGGRGGGRGRGSKAKVLTRQNSGIPETKRSAGRGARGKRTSNNVKIQATYDRQGDLKKSFKEVARMVRSANDILGERELEMLEENPRYHEGLPQWDEVQKGLDAAFHKAIAQQGRVFEIKVDYAQRRLLMEIEYEEIQMRCMAEDLRERAQLKCKAGVLEQLQQAGPTMDDNSSIRPNDQYHYKMLEEEKTDVIGLSFGSVGGEEVSGPSKRGGKKGSPKKRTLKEWPVDEPVAKRHTILSAATAPPEAPEDGDVENLASLIEKPETPTLTSNGPTPEPDVNLVDGDEGPVIQFPGKVRRGRMANEPNNRVIVAPWFAFEDGDIALRSSEYEAEKGRSQPKRFYIDPHTGPAGAGELLSSHKVGDFNRDLVARHRLHPQYGVPIPGSINPDNAVEPTNFSRPLARTRQVVFINKAETVRIETSRSASLVHAARDWAEFERKMAVKRALGPYDVRELVAGDGLATYDATAREEVTARECVANVLRAAEELEEMESAAPAKRQKTGSQSSSLAPIQRRPPYSVMQDIAYATPQAFDKFPEKYQESLNNLDVLADMADRAKRVTTNLSKFQNLHTTTLSGIVPLPYSSQTHLESQLIVPIQSTSRKRKHSGVPTQNSPQMLMHPAPPPQPIRSQSMGPPPARTQSTNSRSTASHKMLSPVGNMQAIVPQTGQPQSMSGQSMGPPPVAMQSMGPLSSMGPPIGLHSVEAQLISGQAAGPPASGSQNMAPPQMALPRTSQQFQGPGGHQLSMHTPQSYGITDKPPKELRTAQKLMGFTGPPPVLPQPTSSAFTRPGSSSDQSRPSQPMLPPPTPSQMASPHLSQQQLYYQPLQQQHQQQQHNHQMQAPPPQHRQPQPQHQHLQLQQPQHQQHQPLQQPPPPPPPPQQPQQAPSTRSHRSGPSNSGLRDILPRPELKASSSQNSGHGNHQFFEHNSPINPYQTPGPSSRSQSERGYGYAPPEHRHQGPSPYQGPQQQNQVPHGGQQHYQKVSPLHFDAPNQLPAQPPNQPPNQARQSYPPTAPYHGSTPSSRQNYPLYVYGQIPPGGAIPNPESQALIELQYKNAERKESHELAQQQVQQQAQKAQLAQQQAQQRVQQGQHQPPNQFFSPP